MKKVRFAVVGLGHFAQNAVLPAFKHAKGAELTALVTGDPKKARVLGKKYKAEHVVGYRDVEALYASGTVDAVYIVTPNHVHREHCERAARYGLHVLTEKPIAPTVEDADAMRRACEQAGVKLMVAYRLHFEPGNLRTIELAQSGRLGRLRYFSSDFSFQVTPGNIRTREDTAGGPLLDIGIYCINAARYLYRDEPIEITALAASREGPRFREIDEQMSVVMRFPDERLATFTISYGAAPVADFRIVGEKGWVMLQNAYEYQTGKTQIVSIDEKQKQTKFKQLDQVAPEIEYFAECVRKNRAPEPGAKEGIADLRAIEAIERSIADGRPVALEPFEKARRPSRVQEAKKRAPPKPELVDARPPSQ